jgi:hypothetical protein
MTNPATTACMIGDRYLASAASLASNPSGPVDALDTRSGRAAQVRVLFTGSGWAEDALSDAVSRWCSLGMSEACGVLDFGPHGEGWFLVVPPSLGMPLERWRTVRRPTAVDAARLTLAFGRVLERIASAGFPADGLAMLDLAVGPGPTPFVERPLLGDPGGARDRDPRSGQRSLAAILTAAHFGELDGPLAGWLDRSRAEGFDSLATCLDDLEGTAASAGAAGPAGALDADLAGLFDEDDHLRLESLIPSTNERRGLQRVLGGAGILGVLVAVLAVGGLLPHGPTAPAHTDLPAAQAVAVDPATLVAADPPNHAKTSKHRLAQPKHRPHRVRRPKVTSRRQAPPPPPASSGGGESTPPPAPPPAPPAQPPASAGGSGATLPDPSGVTTLPPPAP